jgi:hypothetical protein
MALPSLLTFRVTSFELGTSVIPPYYQQSAGAKAEA